MQLSPKTNSRLIKADNWSLRAITGGSMVVATLAIWATTVRVVTIARSPEVHVDNMQLVNASTPEFTSASTHIVEAHYDSVTITATGLSSSARGLLASEAAASGLLIIGLSVVVAILGMSLLAHRPFARSAMWAIFSAAIITMVSGLSTQFFGSIARAEVIVSLGEKLLTVGSSASGTTESFPLLIFMLDPSPIGWGIALGVVAGAFEFGRRLQRDTEGLV